MSPKIKTKTDRSQKCQVNFTCCSNGLENLSWMVEAKYRKALRRTLKQQNKPNLSSSIELKKNIQSTANQSQCKDRPDKVDTAFY
jgi:hypothetical protein